MITSEMTLKNCPLGSGHIVLKICSQLSTNQRREKFTNNPDKGEINYASSFIASQWLDFHHSVSSLPWVLVLIPLNLPCLFWPSMGVGKVLQCTSVATNNSHYLISESCCIVTIASQGFYLLYPSKVPVFQCLKSSRRQNCICFLVNQSQR